MISFILNKKTIVTSKNSGMTLLDFIRYEQRLTGTKIGCREGDCGACTVLVGSLEPDQSMSYQSITSCISPIGNAHGKHIVTIEGINLEKKLSTVQKAMKENYATQCGFCTPGFVVALTGFALSNNGKNKSNAIDAVSGNICRCTGYKSIEKAATDVCDQLNNDNETLSLDWLIENEFVDAFFSDIPKKLGQLIIDTTFQTGNKIIAGGTDLYVQQADDLINKEVHLVADNNELKGIRFKDGVCVVGAANTVSDIWNDKEFNSHFPNLKKHLKLVSSEQIRNMASFGGNLVNASPIGDMTIFFLALDSNITIINQNEVERIVSLKDFYTGYKTFDLAENERIKNIIFKIPSSNSHFNFEKVSKRTHLDIASVNTAINLIIKDQLIEEAHVSIGGVAAIPKYLHQTSTFLNNKVISSKIILEAIAILQNEISPISDVRGSSDYKRLLARQLFFAHFTELFTDQFQIKDLVQYA
jgi:xanthine dehydrogenase small subunit